MTEKQYGIHNHRYQFRVITNDKEEISRIFFEEKVTGEIIEGRGNITRWINKLVNENEQLKQQLRNSVELFRKDSVTLFELKEENKELKVNYKELRYANNIYCNKIDSLKKENEQLKQQLNELGE